MRRQTAARAGEREVQVLDYQNTAADLLPLVAACYALIFMVRAWHAVKYVRVGLSALSNCDARTIAPRAIVSVLRCERLAVDKCLWTSVNTLCGISSTAYLRGSGGPARGTSYWACRATRLRAELAMTHAGQGGHGELPAV